MKFNKSKLWLCLPFVLVFLVDAGITLVGQPAEYWAGDRLCANEAFPLFAWGLENGPGTFAMLCLAWVLIFSALIVFLPPVLAEILSLALVNGHTWGAMTWMAYYLQLDYHLCLLYFALTASVFIVSQRKYRSTNQRSAA